MKDHTKKYKICSMCTIYLQRYFSGSPHMHETVPKENWSMWHIYMLCAIRKATRTHTCVSKMINI